MPRSYRRQAAGTLALYNPSGETPGVFDVLSADPAAPANNTAWIVASGSAPTTVSLKVRLAGTTYVLAQAEF